MKVKIPYSLRLKFLEYEGLEKYTESYDIDDHGIVRCVPGETYYIIKLDLNNYPDLLKICIEWLRIITTYFKTSYKAYRIDIGPYKGVWPVSIENGIVLFHLDDVSDERDWKEWFIKEDIEYAPIIAS